MSRTACLHECLNGPCNKINGTAACVLASRKLKLSVSDELSTIYLIIGRKMQVVVLVHNRSFLNFVIFCLFFKGCFLLQRLYSVEKEDYYN